MILVYQAYGIKEIMRQTIFSIVSLLKHWPSETNLKIVVYTDDLEMFDKFFAGDSRIRTEKISNDQILAWRGAINFVHRVKIEILINASLKYKGALFYADGDTYFMNSPAALFSRVNDRVSLMHIAENSLSKGADPIAKKMKRFVMQNTFKIQGEEIRIGAQTVMWNAGVIGISERNKGLLKNILQLTDEMHSRYPKHVTEQLSVSYILQTRTEVQPASGVIYHYWNQKDDYQKKIDQFLISNFNLEMALASYKNFVFPEPPKVKAKFLDKIKAKYAKLFLQQI